MAKSWLSKLKAAALAFAAASSAIGDTPTVTIQNGSYYGIQDQKLGQDLFLGIPYAQPPVGDLRFHVPQPLNSSWDEARNATEFQSECYQYSGDGFLNEGSDDCLTVNVYRPTGTSQDAKLPVAFWIHGGGLVGGSNSQAVQNPAYIVKQSEEMGQPIVVVNVNYRLHAWGFMWGSAIESEGAGNLGFRDQRLALQWVHENIEAFGGDPEKVTIWGQSGGSRSVASQLTAFGGRDDSLFRGAVMESGTGFLTDFAEVGDLPVTWDGAYESLLEKTGCETADDSLQCLRQVSSLELATVLGNVTFPPWLDVVDGDFIQEHRSILVREGKFVRVPIIIGVATDDGDYFAEQGIDTDDQWEEWLRSSRASNETIEALSALYPDIPRLGLPESLKGRPTGDLAPYGAQWKRAVAFGGDRAMHGPRRAWARTWAAANLTAYSYRFNVLWEEPVHGVGHSAEVPFVFHNIENEGYEEPPYPFEGQPDTYKDLSTVMARMWVSFFNHLDPNQHGVAGTERWPIYGLGEPQNLVYAVEESSLVHSEPDTYRSEQLEYLNKKLWRTGLESGRA